MMMNSGLSKQINRMNSEQCVVLVGVLLCFILLFVKPPLSLSLSLSLSLCLCLSVCLSLSLISFVSYESNKRINKAFVNVHSDSFFYNLFLFVESAKSVNDTNLATCLSGKCTSLISETHYGRVFIFQYL